MSLRERFHSENTLVCLLQGLRGKQTIVELRNESTVIGTIDSVDAYMNIYMSDVEFVDPKGSISKFADFFVQGKMVRFVQIPDDVNITDTIKNQIWGWQDRRVRKERKPKLKK
ncbi:U7 snRNA-associated Sm-like protein LSm10 [Glandiceps talaboti]